MEKEKFTPGPWEYHDWFISSNNSFDTDRILGYSPITNFIASFSYGDTGRYKNKEEQNANGYLISTAPELLENNMELTNTLNALFTAFDVMIHNPELIKDKERVFKEWEELVERTLKKTGNVQKKALGVKE